MSDNLPGFRPTIVEHFTVEERLARGRAERKAVPRSKHADFAPTLDRGDPIALLEPRRPRGPRSWCRSATDA